MRSCAAFRLAIARSRSSPARLPSAAASPTHVHALDAGCCPTDDLDAARWDAERLGEQAARARRWPPLRAAPRARAPSARRGRRSIVSTPSIESRPPLGVSRTVTVTPPGAGSRTKIDTSTLWQMFGDDYVLNEDDDQDHDDRRNVDAAEIGQHVADRAQHRLGDAIEKFARSSRRPGCACSRH